MNDTTKKDELLPTSEEIAHHCMHIIYGQDCHECYPTENEKEIIDKLTAALRSAHEKIEKLEKEVEDLKASITLCSGSCRIREKK